MLAELRMELEVENRDFGYYQSSNMQGVLMECIDPDYAEILHQQSYHPYSQHLELREKKEWVISTVDREAYEQMILPLLDSGFTGFEIRKRDISIAIKTKQVKTKEKKELLNRFYSAECSHDLQLEFMTPTSFKRDARYVIMPELRLIYQSLMNKYSAACRDMEMYDAHVLEELVQSSYIANYQLNSTLFPLERVKIPSFRGKIGIKISGTDTLARYVRFLAEFGEYSGVGIKTAMGMGALKITERGKSNDR